MYVYVCLLEGMSRNSGSRGPAGAPPSPTPGPRGRGRSPESAVAMHAMEPGWVAGQLGEGDRMLNLPGSAFPILYKKLLSRETEQKSY